jgi:periplasmic protein TonB
MVAPLFLACVAPGAWPADIPDEDPLLQLSLVPVAPIAERLRAGAARRAPAIGLALLIEALLLLLLLSFSAEERTKTELEVVTVTDLQANEVSQESPEANSAEPAQRADGQPLPQPPAEQLQATRSPEPLPAQPAQPAQTPTAPVIPPTPSTLPPSAPSPRAAPAAPSAGQIFGPPNTGGSSAFRDTERVGTAPNGEPLYAAAWHREPRPGDLRGYMSSARGPGWGLIACRTAPNYRVEDCVALDEYPAGSQINRAILAAAWEFQVRPPRRGGQLLVGSWVRIRIDYRVEQR